LSSNLTHQDKLTAAAYNRLRSLKLQSCFDAADLNSRPNPKQQTIFSDIGKVQYRYVVAGNQSGKSSVAARELAWVITDTHPTWKRPEKWKNVPLKCLVAGQDKRMIELELWNAKIRPLLPNPADWKEVRTGNQLQHVENRNTGDQIIFVSHSDSSENARKHLQGYVCNYVWLDEMPGSFKILEELQRRVDAREGYFLATFTPKFKNAEIKRVVEAADGTIAKKYMMSKLDNPLYAERIESEIRKLDGYSEAYKRTVLYGEWTTGDDAVYDFDETTMLSHLPEHYSTSWRHVESVDPALKRKFGLTLWAEDPRSGVWYCVRSDYIEGILDPLKVYAKVMEITRGYNIVRRVCDPHESWYLGTASAQGTKPAYLTPYAKNNNRKGDLIKGLQTALSCGRIRLVPGLSKDLITELQECRWSETAENKIVNASSYHLLDTAQYFVDLIPSGVTPVEDKSWSQQLLEGNQKRLELQEKNKKLQMQRIKNGRRSGRRTVRATRR